MKKLLNLLASLMLIASLNAYTPFLYFGNEVFSIRTPTNQYLIEAFMQNKIGDYAPSFTFDTTLQHGSFLWKPDAHRDTLLAGQGTYHQKLDGLLRDLSLECVVHAYALTGGHLPVHGALQELTAVLDYTLIDADCDKLAVNVSTIFPVALSKKIQGQFMPSRKPIPGIGITAIKRLFGDERHSLSVTAEGQYHLVPVHGEIRTGAFNSTDAALKIGTKNVFDCIAGLSYRYKLFFADVGLQWNYMSSENLLSVSSANGLFHSRETDIALNTLKVPAYVFQKGYLSLGVTSNKGMIPSLDATMISYVALNIGYSWRSSYASADGFTVGITSGAAF